MGACASCFKFYIAFGVNAALTMSSALIGLLTDMELSERLSSLLGLLTDMELSERLSLELEAWFLIDSTLGLGGC